MDSQKILTEQLKLMADRLVEEGERMSTEPLVVEYDNGGGQSGIRENPYYPAYEKLFKSFLSGLAAVKAEAGANSAEVVSLEALRSKIKVAK